MGDTNKRGERLSLLILAAVFIYTAIRAFILSISHDEALTFLIHAQGSLGDIFSYRLPYQINNHLLHTLLVKLCLNIFGVSEPVMRIPALAGHILYLVGVYLILKRISGKGIVVAGALLLSTNPYLLDYFSCARGYGLGLGFTVLGLYFFIRHFENITETSAGRDAFAGSMLLALAALSNLTYLNVYATLAGLMILSDVLSLWEQNRNGALKEKPLKILSMRSLLPLAPSIMLLAILYTRPILLLRRVDQLCYGGSNGLWLNTIPSLVESTQYGKAYGGLDLILWGRRTVAILLLSACIMIGTKFIMRNIKRHNDRILLYFWGVLIFSGLCITMQHILFKTLFVIHRTAIYFIPLFYFFIIAFWTSARETAKPFFRRSADVIFSFIVLVLLLHFINCANLHYFSDWKYDAGTKKMMQHLKTDIEQRGGGNGSFSIGNTWLFEPSINFYRWHYRMGSMKPAIRESLNAGHDYYYLHDTDRALVGKYNLTIMATDYFSQSILAKSQ